MLELKNYKELISQLSDEKTCREVIEQWRGSDEPFALIVMKLTHTN